MPSKISVYIIAFNEEDKIGQAIKSVTWADEIVVADSYSTDDTARIATSLGARVIQIDFQGFGDLRNRAMRACRHEWIFSLDADERCTPEVRDEILEIINSRAAIDCYYVPRRNFFLGRWLRCSGFYPDYRQPQLFRQGTLVFSNEPVHESFRIVSSQPPGYLRHAIWQIPYRNLSEVQRKALRYSTLGAEKLAAAGETGSFAKAFWHALWAFFSLFILKRGFLDGWAGFVLALGNFEGTFFKYAKLYERQAGWQEPPSPTMPGN